jgi:2-polyprenyl-6-methoxyphenol hydroxylase-like FAD-dependent oxidoreductase
MPADISEQVFGPGAVFGLFPAGERLFWWAGARRAEGAGDPPSGRKRDLLETFKGWPEAIPEVIEATPEQTIDRMDLYDRPTVKGWTVGCVTLLGDAAHPTMPSLGQGAGMAIEDGVVLARELASVNLADHAAVAAALDRYQARRMPRTNAIVNRSRKISQISRWANPVLVNLRAILLSHAPQRVWQKIGEHEHTYEL